MQLHTELNGYPYECLVVLYLLVLEGVDESQVLVDVRLRLVHQLVLGDGPDGGNCVLLRPGAEHVELGDHLLDDVPDEQLELGLHGVLPHVLVLVHAQEPLYLPPVELQRLREDLYPVAQDQLLELDQRLDPRELKRLEQTLLRHHDGQPIVQLQGLVIVGAMLRVSHSLQLYPLLQDRVPLAGRLAVLDVLLVLWLLVLVRVEQLGVEYPYLQSRCHDHQRALRKKGDLLDIQ